MNLKETFGDIDIYLFDQLMKGRFDSCRTVLDAGCGAGRNLVYFLKNGYDCYGIDQNPDSISFLKSFARSLSAPTKNFIVSSIEEMPFKNESFDLVICNAVLHFARNEKQFNEMLQSLWRVLKQGGFLFVRLASDIGIEHLIKDLGNRCYLLPDGSKRFLVNQQILLHYTRLLGGELFEPIKTTNVQNLRCMTTWCVKKQ
ncbi:MAG TPA: class I SAM-dependent methyltransferase [Patescibacteria group bacterium]|nr:class I SAM-dependent methyltransferase [Patescibacteria group bacterium]